MPGKCPKGKKWSKEKGKCVLKTEKKLAKASKKYGEAINKDNMKYKQVARKLKKLDKAYVKARM